jgi:hypothetical protein
MFPFIASFIYALVIWVPEGLSAVIPLGVYLQVTKDPYLFLLGSLAVCFAVIIEIYASPSENRKRLLYSNSRQIQFLAIISIFLALLSAWSASFFSLDISEIFLVLLNGRYTIIFPLVLFMLSLLINPAIQFDFLSLSNFIRYISVILIISSPLVLFILWRLQSEWIIIISSSLILLLLGLSILVYRNKDLID